MSGLLAPDQQEQSAPSPYGLLAPVMQGGYHTKLDPMTEMSFQQWVQQNKIPFDPSPRSDYDMRGFYQSMMSGNPGAQGAMNPNDNQFHYPDTYKTPYHESFSAESKYATPDAPRWNDRDQLIDKNGNVVFDEKFNSILQRGLLGGR